MDQVAQIMGRMNLDPVKEPRGFIKLIQVIIAIFAFATTTSVSTSSSFNVNCDPDPKTVEIKFGYPFKVNSATFMTPVCANSTEIQVESHPYGDFRSSAEFYVFIGVMAFLYSVGAIILYIFFDDKYRVIPMIPTVDFVISVVFTLLWLISSSAWAQGVTDVKYYTSPDEIILRHMGDECVEDGMCTDPQSGNFASLNVSLIFGFLNTFVWGCNLWFLFKETKWHKEPEREIAQQQQQTPSVPSPVDIPSPQQRI